MSTWPLDTSRPLAFFVSEDGENWTRAATAIPNGEFSFKAEPPVNGRWIKVGYDIPAVEPGFKDPCQCGHTYGDHADYGQCMLIGCSCIKFRTTRADKRSA